MVKFSNKWHSKIVSAVLMGCAVLLVLPQWCWAVDVGGQVVTADQAKNQPLLSIQITAVPIRKGTISESNNFDVQYFVAGLYTWDEDDAKPPPYAEADGWGKFTIPIQFSIDPRETRSGMTSLDDGSGDQKNQAGATVTESLRTSIDPRVTLGGMTSTSDGSDEQKGSTGAAVTESLRNSVEPRVIIGAEGTNENQGTPPNQSSGSDQEFDRFLRAEVGYRLSVGFDGYYVDRQLDPKSFNSDEFSLDTQLIVPNFTSHIDWWKEGLDIQRTKIQFQEETGEQVDDWEQYFGDGRIKNWLNTAWAPASNETRNRYRWLGGVSAFWIGSENNAVTNTAPAQGLYPHTWVKADDASPVATVYFRRSNYE